MGMSFDEHAAHAHGMKAHLRLVRVGARVLRVVSLRPSCAARFSTNLFHHTWHVLSDRAGAFVLARLLWGLSFQRARRTIVVIAGEHLVTTPFEADPSRRWVHADGEVQVFSDFRDRVSAARVARRIVLGDASLRTMTEREAIYRETDARTAALRRARHPA